MKSFYSSMGRCPDFQCHLDYDSFHDNSYATLGYHSKGYLFEFEDRRELVVGSSNITRYALVKNIEWEATELLDAELINRYSIWLNYAIERWDMDYDLSASKIKPNYMQKKALKELNRYRAIGVNRALTIASAGARFILMTGRNALKNKDFGPVFSYEHWMPSAGKRGIEVIDRSTLSIIL